MTMRLPHMDPARKPALTPDQQAESARILCALVRREMSLAEALRALPGQRTLEERRA